MNKRTIAFLLVMGGIVSKACAEMIKVRNVERRKRTQIMQESYARVAEIKAAAARLQENIRQGRYATFGDVLEAMKKEKLIPSETIGADPVDLGPDPLEVAQLDWMVDSAQEHLKRAYMEGQMSVANEDRLRILHNVIESSLMEQDVPITTRTKILMLEGLQKKWSEGTTFPYHSLYRITVIMELNRLRKMSRGEPGV